MGYATKTNFVAMNLDFKFFVMGSHWIHFGGIFLVKVGFISYKFCLRSKFDQCVLLYDPESPDRFFMQCFCNSAREYIYKHMQLLKSLQYLSKCPWRRYSSKNTLILEVLEEQLTFLLYYRWWNWFWIKKIIQILKINQNLQTLLQWQW